MKVPLEGGTPSMLVSGQLRIQALAADATSVYWTTSRTVMKLTPK